MECKMCGAAIAGGKNKRYCESCLRKRRREQGRECDRRKKERNAAVKRAAKIKGQSSQLAQDVHNSIELGITYGVYMGRKGAENLWENRKSLR